MNQPDCVCVKCGEKYGRATEDAGAVFTIGECSVCHDERPVTDPKHFGGLNEEWVNHEDV